MDDRVIRADHRRVRLEEHERLRGDLTAHFGGVIGVVLADADDLAARDDRCQQPHIRQRDLLAGELQAGVERVALQDRDDVDTAVDANHAEAGIVTVGKPRNAHCARLVGRLGDHVTALVRQLHRLDQFLTSHLHPFQQLADVIGLSRPDPHPLAPAVARRTGRQDRRRQLRDRLTVAHDDQLITLFDGTQHAGHPSAEIRLTDRSPHWFCSPSR